MRNEGATFGTIFRKLQVETLGMRHPSVRAIVAIVAQSKTLE